MPIMILGRVLKLFNNRKLANIKVFLSRFKGWSADGLAGAVVWSRQLSAGALFDLSSRPKY
jgi:hypothetical protein